MKRFDQRSSEELSPFTVQVHGIEEQFLAVEMGERHLGKHLNARAQFQLQDRAGPLHACPELGKGGMTRHPGEDHLNGMFSQ